MEATITIKPFLCEDMDKALIRNEWEKWLRALKLYLDSEEITTPLRKRNKLLHLGGTQLQEVAFNIPGAIVEYNVEEANDVFDILVSKLNEYFSPSQNSTFERHLFRHIKPESGENFNKFLLRVRQQAAKCHFGQKAVEATEINVKDKLIDAWAPVELKRKLLEKEYTLQETIEMCKIYERTGNQSVVMQDPQTQASVSGLNQIKIKPNSAECRRCGRRGHWANDPSCRARNVKCHTCGLTGHFAKQCQTKTRPQKRKVSENTDTKPKRGRYEINQVDIDTSNASSVNDQNPGSSKTTEDFDCFLMDESQSKTGNEADGVIDCQVGGVSLPLLIDSGSKANIIAGKDWEILKRQKAAMWHVSSDVNNTLKPYASDSLNIQYKFKTTINIPGKGDLITTFYVIPNGGISILGMTTAIRLGVLKVGLNIQAIEEIKPFPKIKDIKIELAIDPSVKPVQQPLRRIPISVEKQVDQKLEEALQGDIIERVTKPSRWVSPIVVIFKPTGDIRLCVDMRRANMAIKRENYPLPTFESFMTKLRGAQLFSRLDLTSAYHQIELHENSREITTFITHRGMFRYKRLMFGVNSAPEIFQRIMESILAGCEKSLNYLDDVIIFGENKAEHDSNLNVVLKKFEEYGVTLNKEKCIMGVKELYFLGHKISNLGIDADTQKVQTVLNFRAPSTAEEVRSFLGLVTYLGKFIPDLGSKTALLRQLTNKGHKFEWTHEHQEHFEALKNALANLPTLDYFNPRRRTRLIADASPVALGAVLLQFQDIQTPRVISFASKSLTPIERRYSQTEKESLALVWAVERFHYYLAGLAFELVTDHKPLETIFQPTSKPPARIERWVLRLQSFKFRVIYQTGKSNIADSVSRLCQIENTIPTDREAEYHLYTLVENTTPRALTITELVVQSKKDEEIQSVISAVEADNWQTLEKSPFFPFHAEFTTLGPILLRGNRIVVPEKLKEKILILAHEGHPGETVMKRRLRTKVWWPKIDRDAERFVKCCRSCLLVSRPNPPNPMRRHEVPEGPWQCVAVDLTKASECANEELLVIIDYFSRYHEIKWIKSITTSTIITQLKEIFSRLGIPKSMRIDNGRQFTSHEFSKFYESQGIEITYSPPYWAQANGEVENINRSILKRLQIAYMNGLDPKEELSKYTLMYNTTPHGITGKSPAEMLFGRPIRDKIPSLHEITNEIIDEEARDRDWYRKVQGKNREDQARHANMDDLKPGDKVVVKNAIRTTKFTPMFGKEIFEILSRNGNEVTLIAGNRTIRRNISHVKRIPQPAPPTHRGPDQKEEEEMRNQETEEGVETSTSLEDTQEPAARPQHVEPLRLKKRDGMWNLD